MAANDEVVGAMLLEKAKKEFPYLANKEFSYAYTPQDSPNFLETWSPGDPGGKTKRPASIPLNVPGVQILNPKTTPTMIMGDYISHVANKVNPQTNKPIDPTYHELYQKFAGTMNTPEWQARLKKDYEYEKPNEKDIGSYEHYVQNNRIPAYMRGYVMGQFPADFNKSWMSPEQKQYLDQIKQYFKIK